MIEAYQEADTPNKVLLRSLNDELGTYVTVVGTNGFNDALQGDPPGLQGEGVDLNLVLQDLTAHGENVGDTWHGLELVLHHPIVELSEPGVQLLPPGVDPLRVRREVVYEDLS